MTSLFRFCRISIAGIVLCVLIGVALGLGTYTYYYGEGGSYLSNDPRACVNCHIMREQYDGWQHASHHAHATCNDCHTPHDFFSKYWTKAENGFRHSKAFTLQDFHEPIRIRPSNSRVLKENCLFCHGSLVSEIQGHDEKDDDGGAMNCIRCHSQVGHGPTK